MKQPLRGVPVEKTPEPSRALKLLHDGHYLAEQVVLVEKTPEPSRALKPETPPSTLVAGVVLRQHLGGKDPRALTGAETSGRAA